MCCGRGAITISQTPQQADEIELLLLREPSNHPKVDEHDVRILPGSVNEYVARVQVRVHEPVFQQHLQIHVLSTVDQESGRLMVQVVLNCADRPAGLEALDDQRGRPGQSLWDPHVSPSARCKVALHLLQVARLHVEARLGSERVRELSHSRTQVQEAKRRHESVTRPSEAPHQLDVYPQMLHDVRVPDFDRDPLPRVVQERLVHLRDRAARHRPVSDFREHLFDWFAKHCLADTPSMPPRMCRNL
mmetsp:Transcript_24030/g.66831  ORF Transcript_24030/g.66831 Transcript_24030/m.66831 type:complete len:246 (+) Transcript_24030:532-1269(+)